MTDVATLQKALFMIQKLKKQVQQQSTPSCGPIAIVGMSCRLPGANNTQAFWDLLCQRHNAISPIPDARWELLQGSDEMAKREPNLSYFGGYLSDIANFDAYFFGISPREALRMDPQQRLLLEVCYEAFEDAGMPLPSLAGSRTGVFSSMYASQFGHLQQIDSDMDALFIPTGSAVSMAANRLSYLLGLQGPSMVLDTACSSSLIAVHLACLHLQAQLCDKAIVSAVNINLLPSMYAMLAKAKMLSPTGQCHTFDAKADGYVPGEGVGALVLKPLRQALKDNDRIYALIKSTALNQDGKTNGLTAPNGLQQEALLREAYTKAEVDPAALSYVECHGTGTFLGDPIEVQALGEVIGKQRSPEQPCWIGSVKSNFGHLEPAAGIISLIKVALILKNKVIPPQWNVSSKNPHIPFENYALAIPLQLEALPQYTERALAGVSGFGFGGTNAHIVLQEVLVEAKETPASPKEELFTLSAKDEQALQSFISLWITYLANNPELSLAAICYNLHLRRSHYAHRVAIVAHSVADLQEKLKTWIPRTSRGTSALAQQYLEHKPIDWQALEKDRTYPVLDLPLYPWQHKKYWPVMGRGQAEVSVSSYPMQGRSIASPLSTQQFAFTIDSRILPELQDSFQVAHVGYYIEMLTYITKQLAFEKTSFSLQQLEFVAPLLIRQGKKAQVQVILEPKTKQTWSVAFYSYDGKASWILHAKGELLPATSQQTKRELVRKGTAQDAQTAYKRITDMDMPAGDTIRWIKQYWIQGKTIFCELRAPKANERAAQFAMAMHPGIIDACVQTQLLLLPADISKPYITSQMGQMTFYGLSKRPSYMYAELKTTTDKQTRTLGDWYLLDEDGSVIAQCLDLCMTQLQTKPKTLQLDIAMPAKASQEQLNDYLLEQFAHIFAMPKEDIRLDHSILDLGMDSLMAVTIRGLIETYTGKDYPLASLMQGPSIADISAWIFSKAKPAQVALSSWIANRVKQPKAQYRLFCFPYGGGGASIYREWQGYFDGEVEVCPIQLPGRENRLTEKPVANMDILLSCLAEQLSLESAIPFAFFGHSFGALIAFELTRYLRKQSRNLPIHLFASAYPAPHLPSISLHNLLHQLKAQGLHLLDLGEEGIEQLTERQLQVLSTILSDNGLVDYSDERMNKNIIQVLLPIFIGDMRLVKEYICHPEAPLEVPITVFLGQQDTWVSPAEHEGWVQHTTAESEFCTFDQGHLFIREKPIQEQVIHKIKEKLRILLPTPA